MPPVDTGRAPFRPAATSDGYMGVMDVGGAWRARAGPEACGAYLGNPAIARTMTSAVAGFGERETVNEPPGTAPSKWIASIHGAFTPPAPGTR